jgi:hypothetical protein
MNVSPLKFAGFFCYFLLFPAIFNAHRKRITAIVMGSSLKRFWSVPNPIPSHPGRCCRIDFKKYWTKIRRDRLMSSPTALIFIPRILPMRLIISGIFADEFSLKKPPEIQCFLPICIYFLSAHSPAALLTINVPLI